jgi:hypothetical protein
MQSTSFIALTGHLNEYPLCDLISILRRQRKTGRLLIEYAISPCSLYFAEGDLVDAQLGSMGGLQAVLVALSQPNASFNFNPLIQPPKHSINESSQKVILELLGCWDEKTINVETTSETEKEISANGSTVNVTPIDVDVEALPKAKEVLALPPSSIELANKRRNRRILIASGVISLLVSLLTVVALTRWLVKRDISAALSEAEQRRSAARDRGELGGGADPQAIQVLVSVEKGRVARAKVLEHRPGMEAYEAQAVWIARTRRYSATASGQAAVTIAINPPE